MLLPRKVTNFTTLSKPSLRETIKKREVEVTTRDINNLLSTYRNKTKKQTIKAKQSMPVNIRCAPDLGVRRKFPEKAFSFDTAELSTRQILLQQVPCHSFAKLLSQI